MAPVPNVSPSQIHAPRKAPEPPVMFKEAYVTAPPIPSTDAVTQLSQMNLERRSSKRFSENYLAQLTSSPNGERHSKPSVDGVRKNIVKTATIPEAIEDTAEDEPYSASRAYGSPPAPEKKALQPSATITSPRLTSVSPTSTRAVSGNAEALNNASSMVLFFRYGEQTKKTTLDVPFTLADITAHATKLFALSDAFSIYLEDATAKIAYELENIKDVKQRSIVEVRRALETPKSAPHELKTWLEEKLSTLSSEIKALQTSQITREADTPAVIEPAVANGDQGLLERITKLEEENSKLASQLAEADAAGVSKSNEDLPPIVVSANRDHVMSLAAKHEHLGTELTAKLEEAMNVMDRIKKDVLQRKVSPRPQQLVDLSKDFDEITAEAEALAQSLVELDLQSNKLWEEELLTITAEQDALEYQRAFVDDIKADLKDSMGNLDTIKKVEEQKRLTPTTTAPVILDTAADPNKAIRFVQADIKSLNVNHEKRAAAIADAEKLRLKEREYLLENEFKSELGAFVESSSLKNTGGALEIDRQRQEKDDEHRKLLFSPPTTPLDDEPNSAPPPPQRASGAAAILAKIDASGPSTVLHRMSVSPRKRVDSSPSIARSNSVSSE